MEYTFLIIIFLIVAIAFYVISRKKPEKWKDTRIEQHEIFTNSEKRKEAISNASYEIKVFLNKGEQYILSEIQQHIFSRNLEMNVFPQVPILAYLKEVKNSCMARNLHKGMRPDFTIFDKNLRPIAVVEVNGAGHHARNDEIQKMILQSAGIIVLDINTRTERAIFGEEYKNHVLNRANEVLVPFFEAYLI